MADLSPEQLDFLKKHLGYDARSYFAKKSMRKQLEEFWRRRDKAEKEIKDLPEDHPNRATLVNAISAATTKAKSGDLKGAYHDLKSTKETARTEARKERDGVDTGSINRELDALDNITRRLSLEQNSILDRAHRKCQDIIGDVVMMRDPKVGGDREEMLQILSENFRDKQQFLNEWDSMLVNVGQEIETYKSMLKMQPGVGDRVKSIAHHIEVLNRKDPNASKLPHNSRFMTLDARVKNDKLAGDGSDLQRSVEGHIKSQRNGLLEAIREKTTVDLPPAAYTDKTGKPLDGPAAVKAAQDMEERFKVVEDREKKRMEAAKKEYLRAMNDDALWLRGTEDNSPVVDTRIRPFFTDDMMDDAGIDVTDTKKSPDQIGEACSKALSDAMDDIMANKDPNVAIPDEIFEMCTRSADDWYVEAAKSAGITFDPKDQDSIDPTVWYKIKAAGDAMRKTAMEKYPDKAKCDKEGQLTEVTIGGVTYGEIKFLGQGGGGKVWKAVDPNTGNQIVLKTPLDFEPDDFPDQDTHAELRAEASNHRSVSGGESGDCPKNVLNMKGMALAPNGLPLIAMDLAESGDAAGFNDAMSGAERSGLISEGARQAMMGAQMRDVVNGMKAMQTAGMTHHDLKAANVFIDKDGNFKVADFGLARHVDGHGGKVQGLEEFTAGYEPPELFGEGDVTQKSDNFTLGEILDRITDPLQTEGKYKENFSALNPSGLQRKGPDDKPVTTSSLDRLVNKLKDPDPDKRPTLDSVIMSSYFEDLGANYTPDDVTRMKKATAAYSRTVGRETGDLSWRMNKLEGEILRLEASKSDGLALERIAHAQNYIGQRENEIRQLEREMGVEYDPERKARLQEKIDDKKRYIEDAQGRIDEQTKQLGQTKAPTDIEKIDKEIEAKRKQVVEIRKQIQTIHAKPDYKDIVEELEAANKAFA